LQPGFWANFDQKSWSLRWWLIFSWNLSICFFNHYIAIKVLGRLWSKILMERPKKWSFNIDDIKNINKKKKIIKSTINKQTRIEIIFNFFSHVGFFSTFFFFLWWFVFELSFHCLSSSS
jgi:hypothetical protein